MTDPLPGDPVEFPMEFSGPGYETVYLGPYDPQRRYRRLLLSFEPASGTAVTQICDPQELEVGPLLGMLTKYTWQTIRTGHRLLWVGGEAVLDFDAAAHEVRLWRVNRDAIEGQDPLPDLITRDTWESIGPEHRLVYLDGGALLVFEPATGRARIYGFDPGALERADPFPTLLVDHTWSTIRTGHELVYAGDNKVFDWEPATGHVRVWRYDRSVLGGDDPLPDKLNEHTWDTIRTGHRLIYLERSRMLDWVPATGQARLWSIAS